MNEKQHFTAEPKSKDRWKGKKKKKKIIAANQPPFS